MRRIHLKRKDCYAVVQGYQRTAHRAEFKKGQIVRYQKYVGYSHYDAASVYLFVDVVSGSKHEFWLFDDDPDATMDRYFRLISCPDKKNG